jgi:hypothetical protein
MKTKNSMKNLLTLLVAIVVTGTTFAQAPDKMSYQSVIRDASNSLVVSQSVGIQISILQTSTSGTAVYVETHSPSTNANGLVSIEIGTGTVVSGVFNTIDWSVGPYFVKTETDPTGGTTYTITGTSELLSVPYALHAKTAENVINDAVDDADANPNNEIQVLSIVNDTIYLSNGGFVKLPAGFDGDFNNLTNVPANLDIDATDDFDGQYSSLTGAPTNVSTFTNDAGYLTTEVDGSLTNEIQDLQLVGNNLTITNNGTATVIDLSGYMDNTDTQLTESEVDAFANNNGYLSTEVDGSVTNEIQNLDAVLTEGNNANGGNIVNTGQIGVGTATPSASAAIEINSTSQALLLSRMTTAERDAIVSLASVCDLF